MRGDRDAGITRYAVRRSGRRPETSAFSKCQLLVQPLGGEGQGQGRGKRARLEKSLPSLRRRLRSEGWWRGEAASTEADAGEEMGRSGGKCGSG
jgi:hypothetical protein